MYVVSGNEIVTFTGNLRAIGGVVRRKKPFDVHELDLAKGDRIYLFSDGFMDQFGGANQEKYNVPRFKDLLLSFKEIPVTNQESEFKNALNSWRGTTNQTDDVLVIGVEF